MSTIITRHEIITQVVVDFKKYFIDAYVGLLEKINDFGVL
jgi:hypothetical protein